MALIDVSEILSDPDFADVLICERIAQTVGEDGIAVNTPSLFTFVGVVTNDAGDQLDRGGGGERMTGNITVHSAFRLQQGAPGFTADIVRFKGRRYTVSQVGDYSHMGAGFVAATCDLIPLSG
jgi:galactose-6-phosphate isomerase